ncbi:PREDICTED: uncharacterized protein LOC109159063 [Ipomoea nil]|uniref:uncharacterized protein LOC109159063 n=1 Tax=Ipomoea nil TaxID=35883 RepID=UPI0009016167|nr:PREDICTED: uncharacterized protein LOC109159063 [Ipomoea nil]
MPSLDEVSRKWSAMIKPNTNIVQNAVSQRLWRRSLCTVGVNVDDLLVWDREVRGFVEEVSGSHRTVRDERMTIAEDLKTTHPRERSIMPSYFTAETENTNRWTMAGHFLNLKDHRGLI